MGNNCNQTWVGVGKWSVMGSGEGEASDSPLRPIPTQAAHDAKALLL
jgi:hypothetical protein